MIEYAKRCTVPLVLLSFVIPTVAFAASFNIADLRAQSAACLSPKAGTAKAVSEQACKDFIKTLSDIVAVLVAQKANSNTAASTATSCVVITHTLSLKSTDAQTGGDVTRLQQFLGIEPTGFFGPLTLGKVQKWQAENGIATAGSDGYGIVGPKTRAKLAACTATASTVAVATTQSSRSGGGGGGGGGRAVVTPAPTPSTPTAPGPFSNIKSAGCSWNASKVCVTYIDSAGGGHEVELFTGTLASVDTGSMGTFQIDGQPHTLAYIYGNATSPTLRGGLAGNAEVSIIDLTAGKQIAFVASPNGYDSNNTYFQYITDPTGNKYPFIAAGGHYLDAYSDLARHRNVPWDTLCIFDPAYVASPSAACDTGFKSYTATFTDAASLSTFRHDGGWVEDVNGDGWSDINLPFLAYILTISGKTGQQLGLAHFDVAAAQAPPGLKYPFHGGRFYGGFSAFADPSGGRDVLFAAANPVGSFTDNNCNVSRFFAVGKWNGTSLDLKWSNYLSFAKTIFRSYTSVTDYYRLGDELNGCAHRFGDSLTYIDNHPYIIYDLFKKDNPAPECEAEVMAEQKANFTDATVNAANACRSTKGVQVTGEWSTYVLDAATGKTSRVWPNVYVWGEAPNVIPGTAQTLLIQQIDSNSHKVRFDQTGSNIDALGIAKISSGPGFSIVAALQSPPSPPIVLEVNSNGTNGAYPIGFGAANRWQPQLVLKDVDADGLSDIQLQNKQWLGWSSSQQRLILKTEDGAPLAPATVHVAPTTISASGKINVTWSGITDPKPTDWLGLFKSGDPFDLAHQYLSAYVNCASPPTIAAASGSCTFTLPSSLPNGTYKMYLFPDNRRDTVLARSEVLAVTSQSAAPTATLTANGQTNLTINPGDSVTYAWGSTNAVSSSASFTTDTPACGATTNGPFNWTLPQGLSGSTSFTPGSCSAGHTYTFTYTVTANGGQTATATLTVRVRAVSSPPTATLTGNGATEITVTDSAPVSFNWSSTNAASATMSYTVNGGASNPVTYWSDFNANPLSGATTGFFTGAAGQTRIYSYTVTGANGQKAIAALTVHVTATSASAGNPYANIASILAAMQAILEKMRGGQ